MPRHPAQQPPGERGPVSPRGPTPQRTGEPFPNPGRREEQPLVDAGEGAGRSLAPGAAYRLLFDKSPQPGWVFDRASLAFLAANEAAARLFGYSRQELLGLTLKDVHRAEDVHRLLEHLESVPAEGEDRSGTWRLRTRGGSARWVELAWQDIVFASRPARLVLAQDITERKLAEERAREADRRKDELLAVLAHELRNPLAPLRNGLQVLKEVGGGGPVVEEVREMMERQVVHLARVVEDLVDVSRLTRGLLGLKKEVVSVGPLVARAARAARPLLEERGLGLSVDGPPAPLWVEADPARLEQALANLLDNAAKYTDPGGHIWLSASREGAEAVLRVRDTGAGIAPDMLPHLFDPLVQAERRLTRSRGGLGLGLALVRKLIELHGGTAEAFSEGPGRGSEFVLRLPALAPRREPGVGPSVMASSRRVLVVDDNEDAADSLAMLLRTLGHDARAVYDGPSALRAARDSPPDAVIVDLGMPGMDGAETARRLREQLAPRGVVLIALTGWGQEEARRRSREAGLDYHLTKPADLGALQRVLARLERLGPQA
jgi:PAS domain S-box-containing protein